MPDSAPSRHHYVAAASCPICGEVCLDVDELMAGRVDGRPATVGEIIAAVAAHTQDEHDPRVTADIVDAAEVLGLLRPPPEEA